MVSFLLSALSLNTRNINMDIWTSKPFLYAMGIVAVVVGLLVLAGPVKAQENDCYTSEIAYEEINPVAPYIDSLTPEEVLVLNVYAGATGQNMVSAVDIFMMPVFDADGNIIEGVFQDGVSWVVYYNGDGCAVWAEAVTNEAILLATGHVVN